MSTINEHVAAAHQAIRAIDNLDDLKRVSDSLRRHWNVLTAESAREFRVGDRVEFQTKDGRRVIGTVDKINRKTVGVTPDDGGAGWRVGPSILKPTDVSYRESLLLAAERAVNFAAFDGGRDATKAIDRLRAFAAKEGDEEVAETADRLHGKLAETLP